MMLKIKEIIKRQGSTVQELAEKMGISRVGLSQHINGNPSVEVLGRIASALNVEIPDLFEKSDNNTIGVIRHNGKTYEINSIADIEKLLEEIKE